MKNHKPISSITPPSLTNKSTLPPCIYLFFSIFIFSAFLFSRLLSGANQVCDGASHDCSCAASTICWCCDENGNFGESCGNCVWWAWHEACCNWDRALPWCTNANTWDEQARANGYSVGTDPEVHSIFVVNSGTWGHVGWLTAVFPDGSYDTTEMSCGGPCGILTRHRSAGFADAFIYDPDPEPPCDPSPEVCDGQDNDCDGSVDEDYSPHPCGTGECQRMSTCSGGVESCTPGNPTTEVCDGKDNDCDGAVDEDIPPITCGEGECRRQASCEGGSQNCVPGEPTKEICDGLDNDCDGSIDEDGVCNSVNENIPDEIMEPSNIDAEISNPDITYHDSSTETSSPHLGLESGCGCVISR